MIDKRIIYPNDSGGVVVVIPAPDSNLTIEQLVKKDVPTGKPYQIIDVSEVPADRTFRNAWTYEE